MIQTLKNNLLTVEIESHGAELQSIINNKTGQQYLYQGNTRFWGRRSPVLFPIVGSVWDNEFIMDGKTYQMSQHGFARDCEFEIMKDVPEDEAWFSLESNEATYHKYPCRFRLEIGYSLHGERLSVMWRVVNLDTKAIYFQIGAHPAFNYPDFNTADKIHAYLLFDRIPEYTSLLGSKGCIGDGKQKIILNQDLMLPLENNTFDIDTIILENTGIKRVSMLDKDLNPYISLLFNAPALGIWSPSSEAPFVCIEPWYGRADRVGFKKEFKEKDFCNTLSPDKKFEASYMILFENL